MLASAPCESIEVLSRFLERSIAAPNNLIHDVFTWSVLLELTGQSFGLSRATPVSYMIEVDTCYVGSSVLSTICQITRGWNVIILLDDERER